MSDTFRYLQNAGTSQSAAESFLAKKMASNRFTSTPNIDYDKGILDKDVAAHNASVASPYSMGEGTVPSGPAYPQSGGGSKKQKGSMTADELRSHFNLEYDGNDRQIDQSLLDKGRMQDDEGNMWYHNSSGELKYLGKVSGGYKRGRVGEGSNKDAKHGSDKSQFHKGDDKKSKDGHHLSSNELLQWAHDDRQGGAGNHDNGFNSINDVANAMRHLLGNGKKEEGRKPIQHSPEVRVAKERVMNHEIGILSGETSNNIFGGGATELRGDYELNLAEGQAGIGTENSGADVGSQATQNFLESKKADVKEQYKFKPK